MNQDKKNHKKRGFRYSKESERTFFFYATMAMFVFYMLSRLLSG